MYGRGDQIVETCAVITVVLSNLQFISSASQKNGIKCEFHHR
jgi:hypothetical protein